MSGSFEPLLPQTAFFCVAFIKHSRLSCLKPCCRGWMVVDVAAGEAGVVRPGWLDHDVAAGVVMVVVVWGWGSSWWLFCKCNIY